MTTWVDEATFRAGDVRRAHPVEVEFGAQWFAGADEPPWRVCFLEATGEVVAISATDDGPGGTVELLAVGAERVSVERALRGWWQVCGHRGSLPWVRHRLDQLG